MRKNDCADVNLERLLLDLQSPDDSVRAKAVNSLCPCRAGWELFELYTDIVARLMKDRCPAVRAHAMHVFDDAARMQNLEDAEYQFQSVEEMLHRKRMPREGNEEAEVEVRRSGIFKKRRGRFVLR